MSNSIEKLTNEIIKFRDERNWSQFHTLKNLMVSLNLEASELLELAQWKDDDDLKEMVSTVLGTETVADECADIFIYLLMICHECKIDLVTSAHEKLSKNAAKYPVEKAIGSSKKYTEL